MKCVSGTGRNEDLRRCVEEATEGFVSPKVIFFFSGEKNFAEYARIIHEMFPQAVSIGCSAYMCWATDGVEKGVLKATSIEDGVEAFASVIEKADSFALMYADRVKECAAAVSSAENSVCIEFTAPFKRYEEYAIMALNSVLLKKGIPVIGGSAANEENISSGNCALNGKTYPDGCVFIILKNLGGTIKLYRENIYVPLTGKSFTVEKANDVTRTVMRCGEKTAAEAYAGELNVPISEIDKYFFNYPVGQQIGGETYVTAIHEVGTNGSLKHLARIHEGTQLSVMSEGDYDKITRETLEKILVQTPEPSFVLTFNCMARTILFEQLDFVDEYQRRLAGAFSNYIGFSCFGEQLGTKNFNHTMMFAVFE